MKYTDLITLKFTENLSVIPFLVFAITISLFSFILSIKQAAAVALLIFGIVGIAEYSYRQARAYFLQSLQLLESTQGWDTETFLKLSDKVFKAQGWTPQIDSITVDGLIFRRMTTDKPSPFQTIAGPLCPACSRPMLYKFIFYFPWIVKYRYHCLCGFNKILKKDPYSIYKEVRTHFNLPSV